MITCLKVLEMGIGIFPNTHFSASLDGLILDPADTNKIMGCLEIKCPRRFYNFTIQKPSDWNSHLDILDLANHLLGSNRYYHKIQGEIFGTNLDWWEFAIGCPIGIVIERIFLQKTTRQIFFRNYIEFKK